MNLESELTWIEVKQIADEIARQKTGKHLSDIEMIVLQGAWGGRNLRGNGTTSWIYG